MSGSQVYDFPHDVRISKTPESLSTTYDEKAIEFDRNFSVVKNELKGTKISQIEQLTQEVKQQGLENSRNRQI